jgi:hypothetical protein
MTPNGKTQLALPGWRLGKSLGRSPHTRTPGRVCPIAGCNTILSTYNLGDECRVHAETRFPRLRGRTR